MTKKLTNQEKLCFELLAHLKKESEEFLEINQKLRKHSDFLGVYNCTPTTEDKIVEIIDSIIGNAELASYWLYEATSKSEYHIEVEGRKYNIYKIEDLINYYLTECK